MLNKIRLLSIWILLIALCSVAFAQKKDKSDNNPIMWEPVNISERNLLLGPGGIEMRPDLSSVTFIKEKKGGTSEKFFIKDGLGRTWVAKVGEESQSETAAVRLLWALGYKTEINYLVPNLTVDGRGTFRNVRLEARPENIKRDDDWNWKKNPFKDTHELQGLKMMMAFFNNWDLKTDNNVIFRNKDSDEKYYVVSDLGATFGKLSSSSFVLFRRIGRSKNNPVDYSKNKYVKEVKKERLKVMYKGKSSDIFNDLTVEDGRWLANLLLQLKDEQIMDAFRAANYSDSDVRLLTQTVKKRINELNRAVSEPFAGN